MNDYLLFQYNDDGSLYCVTYATKDKRNREEIYKYFKSFINLKKEHYLISNTDKDWDIWYNKYINFKNK